MSHACSNLTTAQMKANVALGKQRMVRAKLPESCQPCLTFLNDHLCALAPATWSTARTEQVLTYLNEYHSHAHTWPDRNPDMTAASLWEGTVYVIQEEEANKERAKWVFQKERKDKLRRTLAVVIGIIAGAVWYLV